MLQMLPLAFCSVCTGTHMDPNVCVHVVHTCMTVCLKDFLCLTGLSRLILGYQVRILNRILAYYVPINSHCFCHWGLGLVSSQWSFQLFERLL